MRIVFAIHGIRSKKIGNWVFDFVNFAKKDSRFENEIFVPYTYGFIPAILSVHPVFKYQSVKRVMRVLRKLKSQHPDADLNIVAHSYGTELSFQAIKRSGEDGKSPIKVNKLILVSSIVSCHREIPYNDTLRPRKIKELHCYCSYEDEVCRYNPFGHSGFRGFSRSAYDRTCYPKPFDDLEICNHQVKILEHSDYFKGDKYYKEWLDIIAKG
ncbi:MAG: alpha/beta hydrolase [Candidatus Omnitrophota bacterium]|nr:MAG: alpha/beta hydrolase [Candidatus Omnitrophota bacterium]